MTIHLSKSQPPQLSLGTVAEMRKMTADTLKNPQVGDDKEPSVSGKGNQRTPQHPRAPRNSARHVEEPYRCGSGPFAVHPFQSNFCHFSPSSNPCGATLKPRRSKTAQSKCPLISKRSMENFTEREKEHLASRSGSVERPHLFGPVSYMIFGTV